MKTNFGVLFEWPLKTGFTVFFQTLINMPGWLTQVDTDAVKQAAVASLFSSPEDSDLDDIHMYTVNA